jgi:hypothetical protein
MIKPLLVIIHGHYMKLSIMIYIYKLEQDNAQTPRWKLGSNGIFHHVPGWSPTFRSQRSNGQRSTFVSWWGNDSLGFRKKTAGALYPGYQNLREFKVLNTVFSENVLLHLYDAYIWCICIIIYNNIIYMYTDFTQQGFVGKDPFKIAIWLFSEWSHPWVIKLHA